MYGIRKFCLGFLLGAFCWKAVAAGGAEPAVAPKNRVVFYQHAQSTWPAKIADELLGAFQKQGFSVARFHEAELADPEQLTKENVALLVVCDCTVFPGEALAALDKFHQAGGNLLTLGGPAFENTLWEYQGKLLSSEEMLQAICCDKPVSAMALPKASSEWRRETNHRAETSSLGVDGDGSLKLEIRGLVGGWDVFYSPNLDQPFGSNARYMTFRAKGDAATPQLAVEWREKDGSRWIATVKLSEQWQTYYLAPKDFRIWDRGEASHKRANDTFTPENAASLGLGLAQTHTNVAASPLHQIWLTDFGAITLSSAEVAALGKLQARVPTLEGISPAYKLYSVGNLAQLRQSAPQILEDGTALPLPAAVYSPFARPQGTGYGKNRAWRYVPLLDCLDQSGRICGNAAALLIEKTPTGGPGSLLATVPVTDPAFFSAVPTQAWLAALAGRMAEGLFLYEGGAAYYTIFENEEMAVGAHIANCRPDAAELQVEAKIRDQAGQVYWEKQFAVSAAGGALTAAEAKCAFPAEAQGPFMVEMALNRDGHRLDFLTHPIRIWRPQAQPQFLQAHDGDFWLAGKQWYMHGVNYMPSSGIGIEERDYFEYWLDPQPYDPEIIGRDLDDIRDLGLNMVSAFVYHRSLESRNVLDLLAQCAERGLKVNLSLRPGTPMDFQWEQMRDLIVKNRLAENDTVIAYDLAWEPWFGDHRHRQTYDREWAEWVTRKYGDLAKAEAVWAFSAPRNNDQLANPLDEQMAKEGPWTSMAADYRHFLNDLLTDRYGRARELVRSVDPRHLVSFRMRFAGDPTHNPTDAQYDFLGLAKAVDILEPEGYGRSGEWEQVRPGIFTAAYGRAVAPHLPIVWAEFGVSCADQLKMATAVGMLENAGRFYQDFYRMAYEGGFNGTVAWWYPGGYRFNERSDYGIFNPDRSPRPAALAMRDWAGRLTTPRPLPRPATFIPVEVYKNAVGLAGIYEDVAEKFWQAYEAGQAPGLKVTNLPESPAK